MNNHIIVPDVLNIDAIRYFLRYALNPHNIHRGNAVDGKYYDEHNGSRKYNVWWTTQPPKSTWEPIVDKLRSHITSLMDTAEWTVYNVDCITTRAGSSKVHAHIDFPYKFEETNDMPGVLGVQIILSLHDFSEENGGTMYMPEITDAKADQISANQQQFNEFLLNNGTQLVANAGSALLYDGKTLHSTMPNNSTEFRSALLINALRNDCVKFVHNNDANTDHNTRNYYINETVSARK